LKKTAMARNKWELFRHPINHYSFVGYEYFPSPEIENRERKEERNSPQVAMSRLFFMLFDAHSVLLL
jgi:hypothetical protein